MIDIKILRQDPEGFAKTMDRRGANTQLSLLLELDARRRQLLENKQQLQKIKNEKVKKLGLLIQELKEFRSPQDELDNQISALKRETEELNLQIQAISEQETTELEDLLQTLPNILADDVPDSTEDQLISTWHAQDRPPAQEGLPHYELGEKLGMMDFERTSQMSGSRFMTLSHGLARMERALIDLMLNIHTSTFDFIEMSPPYLVKEHAMYNSGQLPKFADESFVTTDGYRLIPTSEVSLVNMVAQRILPEEALPLRMTACTPCFRSEVSSGGRDTRGMIRMHQFTKVELVSITTPEQAEQEHELMLHAAEKVLQVLELPYRVVLLCPSNMGIAAKKTFDIEVWLPGSKTYREVASCSNCGDYQARRMLARYRDIADGKTHLVHTLNSSGLPLGRVIAAILENYQNDDGSISVPKALVPYMNMTRIQPLAKSHLYND